MFQKTRDVLVRLTANFPMRLQRRPPGHNEPRELIGNSLNFIVRCPAEAPVEGTLYATMKSLSAQYGDLEFTVDAATPTRVIIHMVSRDPKLVKSFLGPDDTCVYPAAPGDLARTGMNVLETPKKAWEYLYPNAECDPDVVVG